MLECDVHLTFYVQGPFLSRSAEAGGYGVDAVPLRNDQGQPLLPGSHVRGRVREALLDLWAFAPIPERGKEWIGPPAARDAIQENNRLRRFGWRFGDFVADSPRETAGHAPNSVVTRIAINPATGSVQPGALQVIECAVPPGETVRVSGLAEISGASADELAEAYQWLLTAARSISSLGSFRNVGFGRVKTLEASPVSLRDWSGNAIITALSAAGMSINDDMVRAPQASKASTVGVARSGVLQVQMEEPFCVGGKRRDRNVMTSLQYLPGAVLKGAVAHQLQRVLGLAHRQDLAQGASHSRWGLLARCFSDIRFCTAFPCRADGHNRPVVTPLSLFKGVKDARGETVRDASFIAGPFCVKKAERGQPDRLVAPSFSPDWKSGDTPGWDSGWAEPDVELRLRTAIDSAARRVEDEHLFAMELVHPRQTHFDDYGGEVGTDPLHWLGIISLESLALGESEIRQLWIDLEALFELAVLRIGKTKARARFSLASIISESPYRSAVEPHHDQWIVVLQSPALITDPVRLQEQWNQGRDATAELYAEMFAELSGQTLRLVNHFADQQLHGGFLAVRGRQQALDRRQYAPLLATEPGSVFVFEAAPDKLDEAKATIGQWMRTGLPLPRWAEDRFGEHYSMNPFLPQDGFGEIAVNIPAQVALAATPDEIELL